MTTGCLRDLHGADVGARCFIAGHLALSAGVKHLVEVPGAPFFRPL
jgi:hypothetical protein|tara:strand:- start:435 stop:572 length:138 start_codon:yes stop_codon:yes gene_type:complete